MILHINYWKIFKNGMCNVSDSIICFQSSNMVEIL